MTLTYDWTAVPPFPVDQLANSLRHLAELVQQAAANAFLHAVAERMRNRRPLGASFDVATRT